MIIRTFTILSLLLTCLSECQAYRHSVDISQSDSSCLLDSSAYYGFSLMDTTQLWWAQRADITVEKRASFTFFLENNSKKEITKVLHFGNRYMIPDSVVTSISTDPVYSPNNVHQWSKNEISNELVIHLPPLQAIVLSMSFSELDRQNPDKINFYLVEPEARTSDTRKVYDGMLVLGSILSFLCLFNTILFLMTRWRVYLRYALYILSAFIYLLYFHGYLQQLFPMVANFSINTLSVLSIVVSILYLWFLIDFGDFKEFSPKAHKALLFAFRLKLVQIIFESFCQQVGLYFIHLTWYKTAFLSLELVLTAGIIYYIVKSNNARSLIIITASFLLFAGSVLSQLDTGQSYFLEIGIIAELVTFSAGLGYITKQYFEEKNANQLLYIKEVERNEKILRETGKQLEEKVKARTSELELEKEKVESKNAQNELLLKEIHHRVKNNLQMITSLINMQERRSKNALVKSKLSNIKNKISSISLIHEHLYSSSDFSNIVLADYVNDLLIMLVSPFQEQNTLDVQTQVDNHRIQLEGALPIGLIVSELVTNSLKYAFHDKSDPRLSVIIQVCENDFHIIVSDNGPGWNFTESDGLGYTIVRSILHSYDGSLSHQISAEEFAVHLKFTIANN